MLHYNDFPMPQDMISGVQKIRLQTIDSADRLFAVSRPWLASKQLEASVGKLGILSPVHVQHNTRGGFRTIIGFHRVEVARSLGLKEIPCVVTEEENAFTLFQQALSENLSTRPLHLLEKAQAVLKLHTRFHVSMETLLSEFAPMLNIKADRLHLQRCLDLARLPDALQRVVLDPLEPEIALRLRSWRTSEQVFFVSLVGTYQLGKNKQLRLFNLLDELCAVERTATEAAAGGNQTLLECVWKKSGAQAVARDPALSPPQQFEKILEKLQHFRFPHLADYEAQYAQLKSALRLPPQVQFHAPPYFEGNRLKVAFSFSESQELAKIAEKLKETATRNELSQILEML